MEKTTTTKTLKEQFMEDYNKKNGTKWNVNLIESNFYIDDYSCCNDFNNELVQKYGGSVAMATFPLLDKVDEKSIQNYTLEQIKNAVYLYFIRDTIPEIYKDGCLEYACIINKEFEVQAIENKKDKIITLYVYNIPPKSAYFLAGWLSCEDAESMAENGDHLLSSLQKLVYKLQ